MKKVELAKADFVQERQNTLARDRDSYIARVAKGAGISVDRLRRFAKDATTTEEVDEVVGILSEGKAATKALAEAKGETPAISRAKTDSGLATAGGNKTTQDDVIQEFRERQAKGDKSATLVEARLEMRRRGLL